MELVIATLAAENRPIKCERLGVEANASVKSLFRLITRVAMTLLVRLTLVAPSRLIILETVTVLVMLRLRADGIERSLRLEIVTRMVSVAVVNSPITPDVVTEGTIH